MFTGIVQAVGRIAGVGPGPASIRVVVHPGGLDTHDIAPGDSVAVNGCCLTVVALEEASGQRALHFDVSAETRAVTTGLDRPGPVNLEKALRLAERLGGHLMSGHVDGVGSVVDFAIAQDAADAGSRKLTIDAPHGLARYIAAKGSIAVDGVSLTVNAVQGRRFAVNLIPHTLGATTLGSLLSGSRVNLEADLIARYVARFAELDGA